MAKLETSAVVQAIIKLIQTNLIAKTTLLSDAAVGSDIIHVENAFRFEPLEEIILIDSGYNQPEDTRYNVMEYARIKEKIDSNNLRLFEPINYEWLVSRQSFIQKTIGHTPLYDDRVLYGDREVIPEDGVSITVEPKSISNEWLFIRGGLSQEYRMQITIYIKKTETEEGLQVLSKYADSIYQLLIENTHFDVSDYETPIYADVAANSNTVVIKDTPQNRELFVVSGGCDSPLYSVQDNLKASVYGFITSVSANNGLLTITMSKNFVDSYYKSEYGVFRKKSRYFYDSRASDATFGYVSKGSAVLRAAQIEWFGKEINLIGFPQRMKRGSNFTKIP